MNNQFDHLIAKHGILTAFSIARKVSKKDIKKISDKIKKKCKNKDDFNNLVQEEILKNTKYALNENLIPGLIIPQNTPPPPAPEESNKKENFVNFKQDEKKLIKLNFLSSTIAKKFVDNKFNKDEICYIVLSLLSILGLNDQDFKNFHEKYSEDDSDEDAEPEF